MITGRQDVGEAGQVADLLHGLVAIRQFQQVEVGVGHQHVLGLAAGPVAHVNIAVGTAGTRRVDRQAHAGVHFLAAAAAAAGDVERHRDQITDLQVLHVTALLDHLTGDLVAQHQADLSGGTAAHHVLVGAADIGGNHTQNDPVFDLATARVLHFRIVDFLHFDLASAEIDDATITRHTYFSFLVVNTKARPTVARPCTGAFESVAGWPEVLAVGDPPVAEISSATA